MGSSLGSGPAAGAGVVAWLSYGRLERARSVADATFDFRRIDRLLSRSLFPAAGALLGPTILLALRGPSGSRPATQAATAVAVGILLIFAVVPAGSHRGR